MKKIQIIGLAVCAIFFFETVLIAGEKYSSHIMSTNELSTSQQRELNNIQDYNAMIHDLKQGVTLGDSTSIFYLGFIYLNGVTLKDGTTVEKKENEGKKLLLKAISLGSLKALGVLVAKSIPSIDVSNLSIAVKTAQESLYISLEDKDYYSLVLASLILDGNSDNADAIEIATRWIYEAEKKRPTTKMQYILASIYSKLGNIDAANYYLNKSCANPKMESVCQQFKNKGAKNENTVPKF